MAEIVKLGQYDPTNLASVAYHFGRKGEDAPIFALLEQGADPNAADRYGFTALHRAAQFDRREVVRALLTAGADANRVGKWGATALMSAKSGAIADMLLEAGADINAVTIPNGTGIVVGKTALMTAVEQGNLEVAAVLLEHGADTRLRDKRGCNALMLAAWNENPEMVRLLLEAGAIVGLVEAALLGDSQQVKILLAAGADLNVQEMENAFRWAAVGGHAPILTLLLNSGVPINAADVDGKNALMLAAQHGRIAAMRLLLEHGADPNAVSGNGGTALMNSVHSSTRRNHDAVELLLAYGALADVRSRSGWTPLMLACMSGDTEVVAKLLQSGADPNIFTDAEVMAREEGCSTTNALMLAVANGHIEAVKLLLRYGADPLATSNADQNALDTARRGIRRGHKQAEIVEILPLLEAGVRNDES